MLNEEKGLEALVAQLQPMLEATGMAWDVVFIDDGSRDRTRDILRRLNRDDPRFKAIALSRNFGKERAVAAGLQHAKGDAVVLMDADLQHPPEVIPQFIAKWREGYDIVYAQRQDREADGLARRLFSKGFYGAFKAMSGTSLPDGAGDFRLLDRRAVDAMNQFTERVRFNKGLYAWIGFPVMRRHFPCAATLRWHQIALQSACVDPFCARRPGLVYDHAIAHLVLCRHRRVQPRIHLHPRLPGQDDDLRRRSCRLPRP